MRTPCCATARPKTFTRKVTAPEHLGIQGGSNGGLLMGVMLTERPDLFKAIVCQVPLLDMRRFNKLLADPRNTITFNHRLQDRLMARARELGSDGRLIDDDRRLRGNGGWRD